MKCLNFVAIVSCFLNVSLTWSLSLMNEITSQVVFPRNQITLNSSIAEKICYNKFTPRIDYLMEEIKNSTNICVNGADLKSKTSEKVKLILDLSSKCALELNPGKYFTCMKSIAADNKKILNEIILITEKFSNHNKTECLIEIFESAKYRSSSAIYDLNLCLQSIHKSALLTTTPEPLIDTLWEDDYDNDMDNIYTNYVTLKNCVLEDGLDFSYCWKKVDITINVYPHKKITEYDKAENSCVRQFTFLYFYPTVGFEFDLEGCLRHGYTAVIQSEENEEKDIKLIRNLIKFYNSFNGCRVVNKDLNTGVCVNEKLSDNFAFEIQNEFLIKSENYFKKISEIIKKLYLEHLPCIGDMLLIFHFDSFERYIDRRYDLKNCLKLGHKLPAAARHTKEMFAIFETIQSNIKSCTLHRHSPGLEQCLYNYVHVYYDFLINLEHLELVVEFDKTQHTCFRFISNEYIEELRDCLFKKS